MRERASARSLVSRCDSFDRQRWRLTARALGTSDELSRSPTCRLGLLLDALIVRPTQIAQACRPTFTRTGKGLSSQGIQFTLAYPFYGAFLHAFW